MEARLTELAHAVARPHKRGWWQRTGADRGPSAAACADTFSRIGAQFSSFDAPTLEATYALHAQLARVAVAPERPDLAARVGAIVRGAEPGLIAQLGPKLAAFAAFDASAVAALDVVARRSPHALARELAQQALRRASAAAQPASSTAAAPRAGSVADAADGVWHAATKRKDTSGPLSALDHGQKARFWEQLSAYPAATQAAAQEGLFGAGSDGQPTLRLSRVTAEATGQGLVMLNTQVAGAFGKFRPALLDDGTPVGIKELQTPHATLTAGLRAGRRWPRLVISERSVNDELNMMRRAGARLRPLLQLALPAGKRGVVLPRMDGAASSRPLAAGDCRRLVYEVAGDLVPAHAAGIVHRDVKLDNVLYSAATGEMPLVDFGLAVGTDARLPGVGGTFHMLPPEALADGPATHAHDIWSLGMTWLAGILAAAPPELRAVLQPTSEGDHDRLVIALEALQTELAGPHGDIDWATLQRRLARPSPGCRPGSVAARLRRLMALAAAADAPTCAFVLGRMLHPFPGARPSAQQVRDHLAALLGDAGTRGPLSPDARGERAEAIEALLASYSAATRRT